MEPQARTILTKSVIAVVCVVAAIGFGIAGFYAPPVGVISSSVLWFIAQMLVYSATMLGIDVELVKLLKK